ncbi:helix-turn-helix domain-containing protein [Reinekea thalattae]|uniref:HTH cro/C1-type domain-containing protein n=1 Tax=Reinekea thalattae TaxID=2593301 RepID=A0A5C8Z4A5_9GAMM|nr:helix-turn-helix transcriptional regulator [Reinekea thalattae]TXR52053.1 hypothetical protein FME95_11600 [Reinekea thalattae]
MEFKEKLKVVCAESGISLKKISELSGINYSQLKDYNQGRKAPKIDKIKQIAAIPQLAPWRELLMEVNDLNAEESELMILIGKMKQEGREAELLQILREVQSEDDK